MTLDEFRSENGATIRAIARRHGVTKLSVFGSFARGTARNDSDLDLLVETGPETSAFFPGGLLVDLQEALGRRVDIVEPQGLHPRLREQILNEAVPL